MEQIDLAALDQATVGTSQYQVASLALNWESKTTVTVLLGPGGFRKTVQYVDPQATTMMKSLNKTDLSVKSLHRRILEQLIADGQIVGVISGLPD